jgi:hypothetical protein
MDKKIHTHIKPPAISQKTATDKNKLIMPKRTLRNRKFAIYSYIFNYRTQNLWRTDLSLRMKTLRALYTTLANRIIQIQTT